MNIEDDLGVQIDESHDWSPHTLGNFIDYITLLCKKQNKPMSRDAVRELVIKHLRPFVGYKVALTANDDDEFVRDLGLN